MRRAALLALLLVSVLAPISAPAAGSPAPTTVCPVCGDQLERVADSYDVKLSVAESEAAARLHENGTTTWTARVRATNASASSLRALDADPGLRAVAERAFGSGGPPTEIRTVRLAKDTLVVRYARQNQLGRSWGVFRYDGLRDEPGAYTYLGLGADRITVEGPPGTTVARAPDDASVDGDRVTLTSLPDGEGPFLAFAPAEVQFPELRAVLAVFLPLVPVFARNAFWYVGLPGLLFAGGLSGLRYATRNRAFDRMVVARGVGALAAIPLLVIAVDLALGPRTRVPLSPGAHPAVVATAVATLLLAGLVARGMASTVRRATGFTFAAALTGVVAALAVVALAPGESIPHDARGVRQMLLGLPVLFAFPAGVAARATVRTWRGALLGVLLPATFLLAAQFDVFQTGDYMFSLGAFLAVLWGVIGTVACFPLFLLGRSATTASTSG